MEGTAWLVARTQTNREVWAQENVIRQGYVCYLPRLMTRTGPRNAGLMLAKPLFPSYLFVLCNRWRWLLGTFGVIGVIMRGETPDRLRDPIIQQLRMAEGSDGFVRLPPMRDSARVKIMRGPLAGREGLVQGMSDRERVRVLLDVMGRRTDVLVPRQYLDAA